MSTWNIYLFNTLTETYSLDGTVPRPHEDLDVSVISNQVRSTLADGSMVFITPETKSQLQPLTFVWRLQDETFYNVIQTYMTNNSYLKIVTHLAGKIFIGRFISLSGRWLVGIDGDYFEIIATFERME